MDHLRIPSSKQIWQHETTEEDFEHSTLSFGRPRVLSDGALHRNPKGTGSTLPRKGSSGLAPHTNIKGPFEGGSLQQKQISDLPQSGFINSAHNTFSRGTGKRSSTRSNPPERRGEELFFLIILGYLDCSSLFFLVLGEQAYHVIFKSCRSYSLKI